MLTVVLLAGLTVGSVPSGGVERISTRTVRVVKKVDWGAVRARLHELGAVGFHLDTLPDGSCRFVCQLATAVFGQTQCIEARAPTEAEAVHQALARAAQHRQPGQAP